MGQLFSATEQDEDMRFQQIQKKIDRGSWFIFEDDWHFYFSYLENHNAEQQYLDHIDKREPKYLSWAEGEFQNRYWKKKQQQQQELRKQQVEAERAKVEAARQRERRQREEEEEEKRTKEIDEYMEAFIYGGKTRKRNKRRGGNRRRGTRQRHL